MIVLDTNVISEIFRPQPDARVVALLESLTGEVAITAVTLGELLAGVRRLPEGRRKDALAARVAAVDTSEYFSYLYKMGRSILAFDVSAAEEYAEVLAAREATGLPISTAVAQIAAICRAHDATCATRNVKDFEHAGVAVLNPWNA